MNTATKINLEITRACAEELAARRGRRRARFQFWYSTIMSFALLTAGAWLMDGARDHASLMSAVMGNAAVMIWLCVPTFAYFAFQGYRRMSTFRPRANEDYEAAAPQPTDVEIGVHA